jgi:hypothetical protein
MADFDPDAFLQQDKNQEVHPEADVSNFDPDQFLSGQTRVPQAGEPSVIENAAPTAINAAGRLTGDYLKATNGGIIGDAARIAKILYNNVTPSTVGEFIQKPVSNTLNAASAYLRGLPIANASLAQAIPAVGKSIAGAVVNPENILMAPYQMAAYEQDKIRANPAAAGLQNNPYAQVQRGEYATQGQAAAANQRQAVTSMPYGNVTPEQRNLLDQRRNNQLDMLMRLQAAKRVLGQQ